MHYNNKCRFDKTTSQKNLMDEYVSKRGDIIRFKEIIKNVVIEYLKELNIQSIPYKGEYEYIVSTNNIDDFGNVRMDYVCIKNECFLSDVRNILWMKFTSNRILGAVAPSNDVNFQIPNSSSEYDEKVNGEWKYNSSGIIIHYLGERWGTCSILMFPLTKITNVWTRHTIEKKLGII